MFWPFLHLGHTLASHPITDQDSLDQNTKPASEDKRKQDSCSPKLNSVSDYFTGHVKISTSESYKPMYKSPGEL